MYTIYFINLLRQHLCLINTWKLFTAILSDENKNFQLQPNLIQYIEHYFFLVININTIFLEYKLLYNIMI